MSDDNKEIIKNTDNEFEIAFRLLGNELLAFTLRANNFTNKWLLAGLLSVASIVTIVALFGSDIASFANSLGG